MSHSENPLISGGSIAEVAFGRRVDAEKRLLRMTEHFFLKSAAIEDFKAISRSGAMTFTPLTVFIGNNGAGKSSLIEAMETYR